MKRFLILICFCFYTTFVYCQKTNLFEKYLNKFEWSSLPITTDNIIKKFGNNKNNVTLEEFNIFINDDNNSFWKYQLYADNNEHFFEYMPTYKFDITEDKIGLLCWCFYFDDNMTKNRTEIILSIYDQNHKKISSLSIAGNLFDNFVSDIIFDEITYKAIIGIDKNIEIVYSIYSGNDIKEKIIKKYYHITDEGDILENK